MQVVKLIKNVSHQLRMQKGKMMLVIKKQAFKKVIITKTSSEWRDCRNGNIIEMLHREYPDDI